MSRTSTLASTGPGLAARAAIGLIRFYRLAISRFLPPTCRFVPSCSEYAHLAFTTHGFFKGFGLAVRRILKCHPFHPGGYDPVR